MFAQRESTENERRKMNCVMKQSEARNFKLRGTYENLCLRILLLGMYPKDIQTCI